VFLARAADPAVLEAGQDGGLVSALLIWGLATGRVEGALTSRLSATRTWDGEPFLATTREEVLEAAGSRYTYAANPLAMKEAERRGLRRLALVGMSCQASINGTLQARRVNKYARRIEITLGLLCSKSFGYDGLRRVVTGDYGVPLEDVAKVNIKGRFQLWRRSTGEQVEIPLKQLAAATREGCKLCPDFAAEHADIATGGLGQRDGWTLAVVRTARGEEWLREAEAAGVVTVRPGEEDPAALALMAKLAARSRGRWPAEPGGDRAAPRMLPVVQASGGSARTT
jgi:coenzyme F420 hydrogenase subunit beta